MNEDWTALMSSEVMRNYLQNQLSKEALKKEPEVDEEKVVEAFIDLERKIKNDPYLKAAFVKLQKKFETDKEYAEACEPLFVQAVVMLDLDNQE